MGDSMEDINELFVQDGVLLKQAQSKYISFINTTGTIYITQSLNANKVRYIEWKPNDVTVESDIQDQEWAVVNTVQKRIRTLSGSLPQDYQNRLKSIKISFEEIHSFKIALKHRQLTFFDGKSEVLYGFFFQQNCDILVTQLKLLLKTVQAKRDKNLYFVTDSNNFQWQQLDKSFAHLDLSHDPPTIWRFLKSFKEQPMEATFEAFSKVTDYVYRGPECIIDDIQRENLNKSLNEYDSTSTTTHSQGDYEVIAKVPELPIRLDFPRQRPLNMDQWRGNFDHQGKIEDVESIKNLIFRGGINPSMRNEVWRYLLDYYPWNSTEKERQKLIEIKKDEYYKMKCQWMTMTKAQEDNFSEYRERKSLIEKDVNRTDRTLDFFAGDDNINLQTLHEILMTYVMYNFDLGYVQGMSDLLSPILQLYENEVDAFWCFVGFMNKVNSNFDIDQAGMKEQLSNLHDLLAFIEPKLANYLDTHDSGNMFFCFRWLLVWFKRELSQEDVMRFWEVLWTGYPCENFHLLVCVAILEHERIALMENNYGFTEILKHINDLSGHLDMAVMLNRAEGIFYQIKESDHLTDNIRIILGLPILGNNNSLGLDSHEVSPFEDSLENGQSQPSCSVEHVRISPDECAFERSISSSYL